MTEHPVPLYVPQSVSSRDWCTCLYFITGCTVPYFTACVSLRCTSLCSTSTRSRFLTYTIFNMNFDNCLLKPASINLANDIYNQPLCIVTNACNSIPRLVFQLSHPPLPLAVPTFPIQTHGHLVLHIVIIKLIMTISDYIRKHIYMYNFCNTVKQIIMLWN